LRLGLAHQPDKHLPHPPALATEAAHYLPEVVLELLDLPLERCVRLSASLSVESHFLYVPGSL
jgi:hypothetical protein